MVTLVHRGAANEIVTMLMRRPPSLGDSTNDNDRNTQKAVSGSMVDNYVNCYLVAARHQTEIVNGAHPGSGPV